MSNARFDESYGVNPAENYERFFVPAIGEPLAKALVARADVDPDDRVLDVTAEPEDHDLRLPSPRDFLWQYIHSTPLAAVVSQIGADDLDALEREVLDASAELVRDGVLKHRQRVVVASGTKGGA